MKFCSIFLISILISGILLAQDFGVPDPEPITDLPVFWKSTLDDINSEINDVTKGKTSIVSQSPGGFPVYLVTYGTKQDFKHQANYNSAVAARNPAYYAQKDSTKQPVLFFLGPVHGQEMENIVGLLNFIHVLETGKDYRGKAWPELVDKAEQCRILIIPCANPDGRRRCQYDTFLGLPTKTMTKYGQGTRKDGSLYGWPGAKAVHPMRGDVGILGAYFNDNGINIMHDEFFNPMTQETRAIMNIARMEAPDIIVSLHSHENKPMVLQPNYEPVYIKKRITAFSEQLRHRFEEKGLPFSEWGAMQKESIERPEDAEFPPRNSFNLTSALHHTCGAMVFTFECPHGCVGKPETKPIVSWEDILDIQLNLYAEMIDYVLQNKPLWEIPENN